MQSAVWTGAGPHPLGTGVALGHEQQRCLGTRAWCPQRHLCIFSCSPTPPKCVRFAQLVLRPSSSGPPRGLPKLCCPQGFEPRQRLVFFSEERDSETDPGSNIAKESQSAPTEDGGESEPSDEEAVPSSAESRELPDEDSSGPPARTQESELIFDVDAPAAPQEPALQEDGVDLLGLHSEAGLAPPLQTCNVPPSNADLLSCLLGAPVAAPGSSPGDLLGSEVPPLFASPAPPLSARSTPREEPAASGMCFCPMKF